MSDFLEGVPIELHENFIRRRLRLLEWIGSICGFLVFILFPYTLGTGWEIYLFIVLVLVIIILITVLVYIRTRALLKS
jgi:membrane protein DedA with SNARE-associated domain